MLIHLRVERPIHQVVVEPLADPLQQRVQLLIRSQVYFISFNYSNAVKHIIFFMSLFVLVTTAKAQGIRGKVLSEDGQVLSFASVCISRTEVGKRAKFSIRARLGKQDLLAKGIIVGFGDEFTKKGLGRSG